MALSKDWQCPSAAASDERKLGFLNESVEEGQLWLKSQRGSADYRKALDIISGKAGDQSSIEYRSKLRTNRLKRNIREVVGGLANIRPIWGFHTDNSAFVPFAEMMNKVTRSIYLERFFDRSIKEVLQWSAATCTGWVRPVYRRAHGGKGKGNMYLDTFGSPSVVPNQLPGDNDWQEAYVVHLLDEMPIYKAHAMFPLHQEKLKPTSSKYWYANEIRTAAKGNAWKRAFGGLFNRKTDSALSDLYVPFRYTTVIDLSLNTTDQMIPMGEPGAPWYYEVPAYGSMIPDGINPRSGTQLFRKATENDARLYPYRRQMISSESVMCYDGPAFNWHGELDLVPFCVDDWPWEAIGFSMVHDGYEIQEAINEIERGTMDKIRAQLDLPLGYDINAVNPREAKQFDPMQPRARIGYDGSLSEKPFAPVVPPEVYQVRPEVLQYLQHLEQAEDYQLAVRDVVSLAKARALGKGSDQLEALMEAQGPIVRDISRSMERSLTRIGHQLKFLVLEFETTSRLMQYVGPEGLAQGVFDYNPASLVPSHLPHEIPEDFDLESGLSKLKPSMYSSIQRARWFSENLPFVLMPHSVHEITQMTYRMMLIQMRRSNMPIDSRTIAEAVDIGNFGTKPEGNTVYERYWNEKEDELLHTLRIAEIAKSQGLDPSAMGGGGGKGGAGKKPEGRPPSGQQAPHLEKKGDGRPVVSESP